MAQSVYLESYYSTGAHKEDVLDLITQIDPMETPFLNRCGVSRATNTYHEWITDDHNATAATGDALIEGDSASHALLSDKTREATYTQISDRTFSISGTEEAISQYGMDSQYAYQLEKAMKELKIKMERILLGSSAAGAGAAGTARGTRGAFIMGVSGGGATASGAAGVSALTESIYNDLLEDVFTLGGTPDTTFVNGYNKRRMSAFASNNSRYIDMGQNKKLTGVISIYESDFGVQEIVLDRWCKGLANGESGAGLVLKMSDCKVAYLRKPFTQPLAVDGDRKKVQILAEYCLEILAPTHMGTLSAFATAA